MNTTELNERLVREGFRPSVYSLGGPMPAYEGLILEREGKQWKIDHFERGERRELARFDSEEDACERMYELLVKHFRKTDPCESTRRSP